MPAKLKVLRAAPSSDHQRASTSGRARSSSVSRGGTSRTTTRGKISGNSTGPLTDEQRKEREKAQDKATKRLVDKVTKKGVLRKAPHMDANQVADMGLILARMDDGHIQPMELDLLPIPDQFLDAMVERSKMIKATRKRAGSISQTFSRLSSRIRGSKIGAECSELDSSVLGLHKDEHKDEEDDPVELHIAREEKPDDDDGLKQSPPKPNGRGAEAEEDKDSEVHKDGDEEVAEKDTEEERRAAEDRKRILDQDRLTDMIHRWRQTHVVQCLEEPCGKYMFERYLASLRTRNHDLLSLLEDIKVFKESFRDARSNKREAKIIWKKYLRPVLRRRHSELKSAKKGGEAVVLKAGELSLALLDGLKKGLDKQDKGKGITRDYFNGVRSQVMVSLNNDYRDFCFSPDFYRFIQYYEYSMRDITVNKDMFTVFRTVGKGGFGSVTVAQKKDTLAIYAVKEIKKSGGEEVASEHDILAMLTSDFTTPLRYSFQSKRNLYLVMDYCSGGTVEWYSRAKSCKRAAFQKQPKDKKHGRGQQHRPLHESIVAFYCAELLLALQHVHSLGAVYRDLKLENLLFDTDGHLRLTDFGLTVLLDEHGHTHGTAGTPGYWAPEVCQVGSYDTSVDWWSFGVIIYRLLTARRPKCTCPKGTSKWCPFNKRHLFLDAETMIDLDPNDMYIELIIPSDLVDERAEDLITRLLEPDPKLRLGSTKHAMRSLRPRGMELETIQEVDELICNKLKKHDFFSSINWNSLQQRKCKPPFVPKPDKVYTDALSLIQRRRNHRAAEYQGPEEVSFIEPEDRAWFDNFTAFYSPKVIQQEILRRLGIENRQGNDLEQELEFREQIEARRGGSDSDYSDLDDDTDTGTDRTEESYKRKKHKHKHKRKSKKDGDKSRDPATSSESTSVRVHTAREGEEKAADSGGACGCLLL